MTLNFSWFHWLIGLISMLTLIPTSHAIRPWPAASTEVHAITEGSSLEGFKRQRRGLSLLTRASRHVFVSDVPLNGGLVRWKLDGGSDLDIALKFIAKSEPSGVMESTQLRVTSEGLSLATRRGDVHTLRVDEPIRLHKRKRLEIIALVQDNSLLVEVFDLSLIHI